MILNKKLTGLFSGLLLGFRKLLLKLVSLSVQLHLDDIKLAFRLVVLLTEPVNLVLLRVQLDPMPPLNVFLDLHAHDVSVDGQGHLVSHRVDLSLLLLNSSSHIIEPLLHSHLKLLLRLHLLTKSLLKLVTLTAHLLIMPLEVHVQCIDLLLLGNSRLQVAFNCA